MTEYALSRNPKNLLVAMLWHQGECGSFENPEFPPRQAVSDPQGKSSAMLGAFCRRFGCPQLPILAASFCSEWYLQYQEPCDAVLAAIRETVLSRNGSFIDASDLMSNNQQIGNGDDIHFSRDSLYRLGQRYFEAFVSLNQ